jgi:hypothetical protein
MDVSNNSSNEITFRYKHDAIKIYEREHRIGKYRNNNLTALTIKLIETNKKDTKAVRELLLHELSNDGKVSVKSKYRRMLEEVLTKLDIAVAKAEAKIKNQKRIDARRAIAKEGFELRINHAIENHLESNFDTCLEEFKDYEARINGTIGYGTLPREFAHLISEAFYQLFVKGQMDRTNKYNKADKAACRFRGFVAYK